MKLLCENQLQLYCVGCMLSEKFSNRLSIIGCIIPSLLYLGVPFAGKRSPLSCQQSGDTAESQCTVIGLQYRAFYRKHISHRTWLCLQHDRPFTAETAHDTALASSN